MASVVKVLAYSTFVIDIFLVLSALYIVFGHLNSYKQDFELLKGLKKYLTKYNREIAFSIASIATAGSLYLSNILGWEPCKLCWFQRIFMYPIPVLIFTGVLARDDNLKDYVLPLAIIGAPIALIHSLIQRYEQFSSAGCSIASISCSTEHTFHFGYITVPVMALTAFLAVIFLMWRFE